MQHSLARLWRCAKSLSTSNSPGAPLSPERSLTFETLERRDLLAAAGLVDVGTQPDGALSGKIIYVNAGHGITGDFPNAGDWSFQRPLLLNMIEDLGNQDQATFFADYIFRAGATVVPMRPIGNQSNEVVLDNDDTEVTFSGAWTDSSSSIYFGDAGDVPYRFASKSVTETAFARYRPNIPESGFYPVYSWARYGSDRVADQLYRIRHSGGITEVTVNHRRVGNGMVYLGSYYFEAGTDGYVDISNRSADPNGSVVIADMIRFGNGMGDVVQSGTTSGRSREDEAGLYWIEWQVSNSQGISTSEYRTSSNDRSATVSATPRYAEYMNREADGALSDRLFISFHSNAGGGRGVVALHNTANGGDTPNQLLLAQLLGQEVNDDLVDQNGQFEYNWSNRGSNVTFQATFNYGEINNSVINNEFDATIVETGFHDSQLDASLMRDADVRDAIARATYQGVVRYFNNVDGGVTPITMLPGKVTDVRAETAGADSVTVSWTPPVANTYNGGTATGYRIYGSTNGYGFDGGTFVAGGATASYTLTGLDPSAGAYYFKVVAVNAGGESAGSEVVAALPNAGPKGILIVNGFDRLSRQQNPVQAGAERVRPRQSNSFDYSVQVAEAIEASSPDLVVDTASNEAVIAGDVLLSNYQAVVWISGEESTVDSTFDGAEQSLVGNYLNNGGQLFVSGTEIGWDLDAQAGGTTFYNDSLRADYVSDDANTYNVAGAVGSIFEGLSFSFDDGTLFYDADFPDVITELGGATRALNYVGGAGGGAAIQYDSGASTKLVNFAFPFETITSDADRTAVFSRVLDFFDFEVTLSDVELILDNDDGSPIYAETGSWSTAGNTGFNGTSYRFAPAGAAATAQWNFGLPFAGQGEVFVQFRSGSNRTSDTVYQIDTGGGIETVSISQKTDDLVWVSLGNFDFSAGARSILLDAGASSGGSVAIADAVRIVVPAPVTGNGDFDADGDIDGSDFLAWQRGFGTMGTATLEQGDANGDTNVDADDLVIWQTQYATATVLALATSAASAITSESTDTQRLDTQLLSALAQRVSLIPKSTASQRSNHNFVARETVQEAVQRAIPTSHVLRSTVRQSNAPSPIQEHQQSESAKQDAFAELGLDERISLRIAGF
ncbi:MAG: hypothetical protein GXP24_10885 [Planctomycetes bacterium]|nr:hypothetical protein [Planctomycetota bacterium]